MTIETRNFLGVYQAIIDGIKDEKLMYSSLENLDIVAEKLLTFSEFTKYHKETMKMLKNGISA